MSWQFRKVFGRGPVRWSLSKRGIGWSIGIPGLRYGISPNGCSYISAGIPGTGLYWIKYLKTNTATHNIPSARCPVIGSASNPQKTIFNSTPPASGANTQRSIKTQDNDPWWKQKDL